MPNCEVDLTSKTTVINTHKCQKLYVETPLIESRNLSTDNMKVYLKLENTQPSGSFKIRGISNLIQKEIRKGCTHLVASSGGNAGMSAVYTARVLQVPITIFVPTSTPGFMVEKIKSEGAEVIIHGSHWDEANEKAIEMSAKPGHSLIPPFDHPDIWEGNSTCIDELHNEFNARGLPKPDLIVLSVGGGGLLCGVMQGLDRHGWQGVFVLAMETLGADSLNASVKAGRLVTLDSITSVAKCLGALTVAKQAYEYSTRDQVVSEVVSDKDSVRACIQFANEHRMLLETSCGASLAALNGDLIADLQRSRRLRNEINTVVVIVCGGNVVDLAEMERLRIMFNL